MNARYIIGYNRAMADLELRHAAADDIPELVRVINAAFDLEKFFIDGDRTNATDVAGMMAKGVFLLAKDGATLAGCVYVELRGESGYFGLLSVEPGFQGRGLGRLLITAAEDFAHANGCRQMTLRVASPRTELPQLYEKFGYRITGTEPFPADFPGLKIPSHFINMAKDLV